MRSRKFMVLCAVLVMMLCGTAWADSMTLTGTYPSTSTLVRWYSENISVSGGVGGYTFWVSDGTLPPGFYIRQDGANFYLEGIPDTAGKYTFTLRIIDSTNRYIEDEFTVDVDGTPEEADDIIISAPFAASGEAGTAYSSYATVSGGKTDYTFNIDGSLPPGLYIRQDNANFYLEGIPTKAGDYTFTLKVTDKRNTYTEKTSTVKITGAYNAPALDETMTITGDLTANWKINEACNSTVTIAAPGGVQSVSVSVISGTLPPGLSLRTFNEYHSGWYGYIGLYGIPNTAGTYNFTLRAINTESNKYVDRQFSVKINGTPYADTDMSLNGDIQTEWRQGEYYSSNIGFSGWTGSYFYTVSKGSLPPGLSFKDYYSYGTPRLEIYGIPNKAGTYTFTLRCTDARYAYAEKQYTIKINDTPYETSDMSISGSIQSDRRIYQKYAYNSEYLDASGYTGSTYWGISSGSLPPGVYIRPAGARMWIDGKPTESGDYRFTVRVTDSRNAYTERKCTIRVHDTPYETADMEINKVFPAAAEVGTRYVNNVEAGGSYIGFLRWSVVSGTLPPVNVYPSGYNGNHQYFSLDGTPNKAGTYTFTLRVTDTRGAYTEKQFTVNISGDSTALTQAADISLSGIFAEGYTVSEWYSSSVQVGGGTADYRFSVESGSLPPGFYIRQEGDKFWLEGVPDTAGTYKFKLQVSDARSTYTEKDFTVKINGEHSESDTMTLTGNFPEAYTASSWYSQKVQAEGGTGEYTYSITSGDLPSGFFIRQDGSDFWLEGIPNTVGSYTFTLEVSDSHNEYTVRTFTVDIYEAPLAITTGRLDAAVTGRTYSQTLAANATVSQWRISDGNLPSGLALNSETGVISGTVAAGSAGENQPSPKDYTFEVTAGNISGKTDSRTFTISVYDPVKITSSTLPDGRHGVSYNAQIESSGTSVIWTLKKDSQDISSWLTHSSTQHNIMTLGGIPTKAGEYAFTIRAENACTYDEKNFTLTVKPVEIDTGEADTAIAGREYNHTFTAEGGVSSWRISSGDVPGGLTLANDGKIAGTISDGAAGTNADTPKDYVFYVTASNDYGGFASGKFTLTVHEPVKFVTDSELENAKEGVSYEALIAVNCTGTSGISWTVTGLPAGLNHTENGRTMTLSGTPANAGTYTFTVKAANPLTEDSRDFTLTVDPKPAPALKPKISLPKSSSLYLAGQSYTIKPTVTGTAPITWSSSGTLPPGFTFDSSTGEISGILTATDEGKYAFVHMPYTFTISATNRAGTDSADIFIPVYYPADIITDSTLPSATKNASYSTEIKAEGTEFSMNWKKASGNLPKGVTLSMNKSRRTCTITGSPTETGTFTFTLKLSNIAGFVETQKAFTLTVNDDTDTETGKPEILTSSLPDGETGAAYVAVLDASGQKPVTWSKSGSFPKGLKLDKYGTIIGVPTKPGAYTFTVKAKNKAGTASRNFTVTITGETYAKPKIATKKIPEATVNQPYSVQLEGTGTSPVTWTFDNTKYPAGLYITEDGHIAGIPKEAGKFSVKVRADNNIGSATKTYSLKVNGATPSIVNEEISDATVGEECGIQLLAEGSSPVTWSKSGKFPTGLKLNAKTGAITGSPKKAGTYTFKVTAKNKYGKDIRTFTMYVWPAPSTASTPPALQDMTITEEYSQPETEADGTEIDLCVVSGDEELRGEIYAPEGRDITFRIGTWPGGFDDAEVYIADEAIALEIADDGTFTLPGELVYDEFVIYVMAGNTKTIELYVVAESDE